MTSEERINAVAYAIESAACKPLDEYNPQPRFNILAIAAIAAADATRPKLEVTDAMVEAACLIRYPHIDSTHAFRTESDAKEAWKDERIKTRLQLEAALKEMQA